MTSIPEIRKENNISTFYVDGKPFLSLGGELHNSSSSCPDYMQANVWSRLRNLCYNSVVATVSWEQIEPVQGQFDFSIVDELLKSARSEGIRLILIWFGLWKNGESTYVPGWMKKDPLKYWKCKAENNTTRIPQTISPFCAEAVEADSVAFTNLMKYIRDNDPEYTVIMMQVENEMGLLGSARDHSQTADELFDEDIPEALAAAYQTSGNWKQAFGYDADEYFMAWYYAKATEVIAAAGIKEHPLPIFVNAWLRQHPERPGRYPSGGPVANVIKIWRIAAPTICLYAPDIYVPNFEDVCAEYSADGNPLFIPETRRTITSASTVFLAVGKYNALGFHPFGIESMFGEQENPLTDSELIALNIDPSAVKIADNAGETLSSSYKILLGMWDIISKYRGSKHLTGFYQKSDESGCILRFANYDIEITYELFVKGGIPSGGLVIEDSENDFIFAGVNFHAAFLPKTGVDKCVDFIQIREGEFFDGKWIPGRILNGDELGIKIRSMPKAIKVEVMLR